MPRPLPLFLLLFTLSTTAQPRPSLPIPPKLETPTELPPIPRDTLEKMYATELGPLYTPTSSPALHQAHHLLDQYFAATKNDDRKTILSQLTALNLSPTAIGKLSRLRIHWPELAGGVYYINERVGPHPILYFLGVPKSYDRTKPHPLVIKLPGAHAFVTDPPPTADQVVDIYSAWIIDELTRHPDALVLMPLLNLSELYGPSYKGMNTVIQPLHHAYSRVNIDPARVYLTGHGMAAHATWNLALHFPTYFAAINPMAGGASAEWQRLRMRNLRNVPAIVWHDAEDPVIKPNVSADLVKILRGFKFDVEFDESHTGRHDPADETAELQYQKMRKRKRDLYPVELALASNRPDTMFNRNDWLQVYQPLNPGQEHKEFLQYGSGSLSLHTNPHAIAAAFTARNKIEIESQNVQSFRIYLNDQMVDFSKPVTVIVNKRPRFEGLLPQSLETTLTDQITLGRGWRYYTAQIDIDFGAIAERPTTRPATRPTTTPASGRGRIIVGPETPVR